MTWSSNAGVGVRGVSSSDRLSMFDFNEDDERIETTSKNILHKYTLKRPKINKNKRKLSLSLFSSPINKYTFLHSFAGSDDGEEKESRKEPIVIDDDDDDDDAFIDAGIERGRETHSKKVSDGLVDIDANSAGHSHKLTVSSSASMIQEYVPVEDVSGLDAHLLPTSPNHQNDHRGMILDGDNDRSEMCSSSTSICTLEENEVPLTDPEVACYSHGHKDDTSNNAVVVFPDFFLYGDIYCTESRLTFSSICIKVEGSAINGSKGTFNAKWSIGDIVNIESEWCGRVETAMINLHFKPNAYKGVGNECEFSGIDKLKFSVYDPCWSERQEAIKSLDVRYRDVWNVILDTDGVKDGKDFTGSNSMPLPKPHLHVLEETFEDVIFPEGDPDAVSISKRDVELLQPETFINDTIIDFYIKFLNNKIQPEDQHRFHFFNSFFFRKLADIDKDPSSVCEGWEAFQRVRKWTKKVNMFEKDYIFIPVNYSLHWSLIVICHPGEVAHFRGEACDSSALKVPCILHMDSIRGSHRGLKNLFQSYLCEEWKARHSEIVDDDVSSKFSRIRFVPLELPQQENSYDCGLFLLHYVELFLEDVPINFSPFKITEFSNYLNRNWFLPQEASLKRARIKNLICEILEDRSQKVPQEEPIVKYPCSQFFGANPRESGVEFLEEKCSTVKMCQGESSSTNTELGFGISVPWVSSPGVVQQQIKEPGLDAWEVFELRTSARLFSRGNYSQMEPCRINHMPPIEEMEDSIEEVSDSSSDSECHCQITGMANCHKDFRSSETWCEQNGTEEIYFDDSSSGTSSSESQKSSEIGVDDNDMHHEWDGFSHAKEVDGQEPSTPPEDLETCIVKDSQEEYCTPEESNPVPNDRESGSLDQFRQDNKRRRNENLMSESDEQVTKLLKFTQ